VDNNDRQRMTHLNVNVVFLIK